MLLMNRVLLKCVVVVQVLMLLFVRARAGAAVRRRRVRSQTIRITLRWQARAVVHEIVVVLICVVTEVVVLTHRLMIRHRLVGVRIVLEVCVLMMVMHLAIGVRYVHVVVIVDGLLKALDFLLVKLVICSLTAWWWLLWRILINGCLRWSDDWRPTRRRHRLYW